MIIARQSTARTVMVGPVLDADGVAVTDCVVGDFEGSVNGGDPAALNGSATLTHRGVGFYSLALTATDLGTVGSFQVTINDTTNACPMKDLTVIEEVVYDALFAASATGALPVSSGGIAAAAFAAGAIDAAAIANGAIDAATFAADVDAEILSYLVDDATRIDASALNTASSRVATALPNSAPAANNGLPTVNSSNQIAGIAGTITTLDALDTAQDVQHSTTQTLIDAVPTNSELATALGNLNDLSAAEVNAEVDTALADIHLDHLLATTYDPASKPGAADALLNELVENDGGVARFTANALEQGITGTAANRIADHVRRRTQANVEASDDGDALSLNSEYGFIQQAQESNTTDNAGKLTVYKADGTTELGQITIATDGDAEPITGVS